MARGKRLIPASKVDEWEAQLRKAVEAALAEEVAAINRTMRNHGLTSNFTAATNKKGKKAGAALGAIVISHLWDQSLWQRLVAKHVAPAAEKVAIEAGSVASAAMPAADIWGLAYGAENTVNAITSRALSTGAWIGDRVNNAALADDDIVEGVGAVLDTSGDILGNIIGALGNMAATNATNDVAQYVTSYGAPTYLSATKTWNTQEDDRVREWHDDADGQEVAINEMFTVMEEQMTGPGDPNASEENTINCRCYVTTDGLLPEGGTDYSTPDPGADANVQPEDSGTEDSA